eukprot:334296_1
MSTSHILIGFGIIPIENNIKTHNTQQYDLNLFHPKTKSIIPNKEIVFSVQLFNHQNALDFMRFPTPNHYNSNDINTISISPDSRIEYVEDLKTYKDVINSDLFQSIRSQLTYTHFGKDKIRHGQEQKQLILKEIKKPTLRLFEAIERELSMKQAKIEHLELKQQEKGNEFKIIGNEIVRLRKELITIKRLNQRLSIRLQQIMYNDSENFRNINNLSSDELQCMVRKYANGHKIEKKKRKHLEKTLLKLIEKLKAAKQIHYKLVKIQSAAQQQAEYIRELQNKQNDMDEYKDTIISQEQVIEKLEEMLSWAHGTIKCLQQKMESGQVASNRERELENEIIALQQENEELRKQIQKSTQDKFNEISQDVDKLKSNLKQANFRNDGLQKQLEQGAGQFGQQIAGLKIQISKLQESSVENEEEELFSNLSDTTAVELSQLSDMLDSVSISTHTED